MHKFFVSFHAHSVELQHPPDWERDLWLLFGPSAASPAKACSRITLEAESGQLYAIHEGGSPTIGSLSRSDALIQISEIVTSRLAAYIDSGVALHAGAVAWNGCSVLIPGQSGAGKSSLTAWFVDRGFTYLTDELSVLCVKGQLITGLARALILKPDADMVVSAFPTFISSIRHRAGANLILRPQELAMPTHGDLRCGLIIFASFTPEASLAIEPLSAAKACMRLMGCNVNARNLADGGFAAIRDLAQRVPAVELRYGTFAQIDEVVDTLVKQVLDSGIDGGHARRVMAAFAGPPIHSNTAPAKRYKIPAPTPHRTAAKLTIGMATYDDYDGVYFSLQALRMYHPEIAGEAEFVVVDNHPDGVCAEPLKALENCIPNYRYIPEITRSASAVKGRVFAEASGGLVLYMDCHVFVVPGALRRLLEYFDANPETSDLLQGPLLRDDLTSVSTHWRPEWRGGMYGAWDDNGLAASPAAAPFEIPMQGLGLFACRREAWLGFNDAFRGFGGEEGYLHEKFRQAGARTLCLPFLRWMHRFSRPNGVPYPNTWEDRIWNYIVGLRELGLPLAAMEEHFKVLLGETTANDMIRRFQQELDEGGHAPANYVITAPH